MMLIISGMPIEVCKKNIKNMHLYVKPPNGNVMVSAPLSMSDEAIERFVRTKISWIKMQVSNFDNQLRQSERKYISGETLYVWGKQYYIQTQYGNKNSLVLSGNKALLTVRKESGIEQRENFIREWYREMLKIEVARLLPKWEKATGLKASSWQTKYMTTKWGTCNTETGKIWINVQLAKKTPECLEYIILHELIHLAERNHNERFVSLMDKYMPMWREVKVTLNSQALDFMELK
ncbi:M48 family metallopeptidase [Paenibacillus sp. Leaf72]|uniref:M48 family metallopeptidase n=1 Tax=Paenibacillus sp. Leaf72 TaxID=1736234 RepID=UPI0006FA038D|nr:SprT family zinc-dependent metalloprotease [Paenibacillus sp. Leaf72]KQO18071.1 metal-dependent hydrolase [Paenibacillus sp. Leaf72]